MVQTQDIGSSKYATVRRLGLLALLPAFSALLLALLWYVVLVKLAEEEKRAVKNAISDTNSFVGAFEQYVERAIGKSIRHRSLSNSNISAPTAA